MEMTTYLTIIVMVLCMVEGIYIVCVELPAYGASSSFNSYFFKNIANE